MDRRLASALLHGLTRLTPLILATVFLTVTMPAMADSPHFSSKGFDLISRKQQNRQLLYKLNDERGLAFTIVSEREITRQQLEKIVYFHDIFTNWSYLEISSMTYVFYEKELEINIRPERFVYKNVDFTRYISAGLGFFHDAVTTYNFRLNIDDMYPRIEGRLTTEEELCEAILAVIQNPREAVAPQEEELSRMLATKEDVSGVSDHLSMLEKRIEELEAKQSEHESRLQALEDENALLHNHIDKIRKAILVLHNLGLFGNIHVVDREAIALILELKAEEPNLQQEEVARILRKEGHPLSAHEIFLVFSVYFNEFK
ncbi:MAG: hypothetical protein K9L68_10315 [Spirochaetales bacterium]|nr:hypothetical protein [Spirochaetales bacterium]MCF7938977.1 hypothetical protein [Spirochaetales bacterium]